MTFNLVDFSSTCRTRITAAAATLGGVQQVLDRDEDPGIIAKNAKDLPTICVIPIGESKLNVTLSMGGNEVIESFEQHIVGYYRLTTDNKTPYAATDTMRGYAKTCLDLFSGQTDAVFNGCVIYKATIEIKPYEEMDYVIDRFLITLGVYSIEI